MARQTKTQKQAEEQAAPGQAGRNFSVARVYIKDLSFESAQAPKIFEKQWTPKLGLEVDVTNEKLNEKLHEVVLRLKVTVKTDDETAFLIEIQQAGVFVLEGFDEKTVESVLGSMCPNILFPYARETIDSLAVKGTFPAPMLAPINFDALMEQRKKKS
jgi:preprotein translocase subunit SecB